MSRVISVPLACLVALVMSCGGGSAQGPAKTAKDGEGGKGKAGESEDQGGEDDSAPAVSACADGTCLECGAGLCPKGFYCDEKAPGGAACSWLPECGGAATCACVKQVLGASCSCSEKQGGPSVSCQ